MTVSRMFEDDPARLPTAVRLLGRAVELLDARGQQYDSPKGERSMLKTVTAFNTITGNNLTESQGWLFMQILKDVRLFQHNGYHRDSAEDCIGYAALKAEAKQTENPFGSIAYP